MLTIEEAIQLIIKRKKELNIGIKLEEIKQDFEDKEDADDFTTTPHFNAQMKLATYITILKNDIDPHALSAELYKYWYNEHRFSKSNLSEEERALWDLCNVVSTMNVKI
jgi:hypothetical protein